MRYQALAPALLLLCVARRTSAVPCHGQDLPVCTFQRDYAGFENGGSLTIIASALIETGSRMDDFTFQEFKGTGNMELVLSREIANMRIWPAMDIPQSGTRKEELLLPPEWPEKVYKLRRRLLGMRNSTQPMEALLAEMAKFKSNAEFLTAMRD